VFAARPGRTKAYLTVMKQRNIHISVCRVYIRTISRLGFVFRANVDETVAPGQPPALDPQIYVHSPPSKLDTPKQTSPRLKRVLCLIWNMKINLSPF